MIQNEIFKLVLILLEQPVNFDIVRLSINVGNMLKVHNDELAIKVKNAIAQQAYFTVQQAMQLDIKQIHPTIRDFLNRMFTYLEENGYINKN